VSRAQSEYACAQPTSATGPRYLLHDRIWAAYELGAMRYLVFTARRLR
jgi:hypothetical protein